MQSYLVVNSNSLLPPVIVIINILVIGRLIIIIIIFAEYILAIVESNKRMMFMSIFVVVLIHMRLNVRYGSMMVVISMLLMSLLAITMDTPHSIVIMVIVTMMFLFE